MKSTQRQTAVAASFFALSLAGIPLLAQQGQQPAQRGGPAGPDTPYLLVATFQSADRKLGVDAADEVRKRFQSEHSAKELFVIPKNQINATLDASGYRPDSALNASDLMELSKQLHGEYVLDGKASKSGAGSGVRLETRILMKTGTNTLVQPLPPADGKDVGDAAKMIEKSFGDALKAMLPFQNCIKALRAQKYDEAATAARAGILAYSNSVISRICLLNAFTLKKEAPDSIINVANQILAADPTSMLALDNLAKAYTDKGDKEKAIEINMRIYRADPSNSAVAQSIVQQLAQSGAPDKALPIIDSLLKENPADPGMLRTKWLLQLKAGQSATDPAAGRALLKSAIATGEELAKVDTAAATLDYFNRQVGAAQQAADTAGMQMLAAKASQKFPKETSFPLVLAQIYRKAGQLQQALQQARRVTEIDPKNSGAWLFAVVTANELNQPDTALALAQRALAAGADKDQIGQALIAMLGPVIKKAQDSKERSDWDAALKTAQIVDGVAATPATKFFIGLSSFQIGLDALTSAQKLGADKSKDAKESKLKACAEAKVAEDQWATAQVAIVQGASYNKEGAGQIMSNIQQYSEYIPQMKKAYCPAK